MSYYLSWAIVLGRLIIPALIWFFMGRNRKLQANGLTSLYKKRWRFSLQLVGASLVSCFLLNPTMSTSNWIINLCMISLFAIPFIYYALGYQAKSSPNAKLAVVPHWRKKDTVAIHLQHPSDAFNTETYRELPVLLQELAKMNIRTVTLTSPMFGKNGKLRPLTRFKRSLSNVVTDDNITSSSFSILKTPLEGIVLGVTKYMKKAPALQNTDLSTQYQLTLTLREQI